MNSTFKNQIKKLSPHLILKIYKLMVKTRTIEERMIQIYRQGQSAFWIGGPGEEAFGVPLGLLVNKGCGIKYDWLHLHYRSTAILVAMGLPIKDIIRLGMNKKTDKQTGGRNFVSHFCIHKWNVAPVTSVVSSQYNIALGTAHVQSRETQSGITIVTGGDAGTAEGDFATGLIWASKPSRKLPMLITVQNNQFGISTPYKDQHGESNIIDRSKAFNINSVLINGNDPLESYCVLDEKIKYIRKNRVPVLLEARVSRLYGHSSASGANYVKNEPCCISLFEENLKKHDMLTQAEQINIKNIYQEEAKQAQQQVNQEEDPDKNSIWDHVYANNENANWKNF